MDSSRSPLALLLAALAAILPLATTVGEPAPAVPLAASGDIIALAAANRDRWHEPKGTWDFKSDSLTGSGDCRIDFKGPFQAPFTLEFRLAVLKGMRPRVHIGPLKLANEGYERTLALYPSNADGVPFSYEENSEYRVAVSIERESALLTIDGRKIMTAPMQGTEIAAIGFSGGDWWSRGATRFSDILIRTRAPAVADPPAAAAPLPGGADNLHAEFERDAATLATDRKSAAAKLASDYAAKLDALSRELTEQNRPTLAAAARTEKARVEAGAEIAEESVSRAPFEVLKPRAEYLERRRKVIAEFDAKAAQRAARYLAALAKLASAGGADAAIQDLLEKERARLPQASQAAALRRAQRTNAAGGGGGGPFEETAEDDALLTGFILHTGNFAGHDVIVSLQPIFSGTAGRRLGTLRGVPQEDSARIEAAEGYAVGAINFHSGDRVDGFEVVFMRIKPGRLALDPADSYKSEWVGGKGGGPVQIGGSGNAFVGIFGATGKEFDSLGLIELLPPPTPTEKNREETVKEVTRANPAALEVANLTAETLAESPNREAGKWKRVPDSLRGARIFSGTTNKHLGVAEYKVTTPGRVYLACNYDYQGNRAAWGGWPAERWMPEDFLENGWARVEGIELKSWEADRTFIVFTKELKAGETGRLRCNKYEPPYFITFTP